MAADQPDPGNGLPGDSDTSDDSIDGGHGNDENHGGTGSNTIDGGGNDDSLFGGESDDSIVSGTGNDNLTGGGGNDRFNYSPGDGDDTITDFNAGNTGTLIDGDVTNNDPINLSGFYDHISELYATQADGGILNQSNATDTKGNATYYSDKLQFGSGSLRIDGATADKSSSTPENTGVVCFTSGTAIRAPRGDALIDELAIGDLVTALDNGLQRICWIGRRTHGKVELQVNPNLRPVLIKQGVLGAEQSLLVSPQHGMLIGRNGDHLARAKHLAITTPGVRIANGKRRVTYIYLMFEAHQVTFAENTRSESFYPAPMA